MRRIDPPSWTRKFQVGVCGISDHECEAIRERRAEILRVVHNEVEAYLNDPLLYFDGDEDGFPHRERLTGEYYIGDESYIAHREPRWFQIGIMCRCTERDRGRGRPGDYLGLEVWLRCEPETWSFSVFRNTDSSSI